MPWKVAKEGKKFKVVKSDSGKKIASHDSEASAKAHVRALYANYDKGPKKGGGKSIKDVPGPKGIPPGIKTLGTGSGEKADNARKPANLPRPKVRK